MKKVFVTLSLCACSLLFASEKDYNWEFTPTIGGVLPTSGGIKKVGHKNSLTYGFKIAKNLDNSWFDQIEFGFDYSKLKSTSSFKLPEKEVMGSEPEKSEDRIIARSAKLYSYQFNFIKNLADYSDKTKLYGLVGLGYLKYNSTLSTEDSNIKVSGSSPFAQVGLGLKHYLSDNFALRLEVRDAYTFNKVPKKMIRGDKDITERFKKDKNVFKRSNLLFYSLGFSIDFGKRAHEMTVGDSDNDGVPDNVDRCPNTPANVVVDEFGCEKVVRMNDVGVNFKFDSAKIRDKYIPEVKEVANFMKMHKAYKTIVAGYTDSTGSAKYNQKLSVRRANAFANVLTKEGVESARITTVGYGEKNPVATNKTKAGRAQNRRVEATFRKK